MIKLKKILYEILNSYSIECSQKPDVTFTKLKIKFVTKGEAEKDIEIFHQEMATSNFEKDDLRIPGIRTVKFKTETLTRI